MRDATDRLKIVFLGATEFSAAMLRCLLANGFGVSALFMIPREFDLRKRGNDLGRRFVNNNYADLGNIAAEYGIQSYTIDSREGRTLANYSKLIGQIAPDVILVLGWYYVVPRSVRNLAAHGAIGIHASLLPSYAGGSPLVWALINGEQLTGITMFRLDDGVDDGDILAQEEIPISIDDTIGSLYQKVTECSKNLLITTLNSIQIGTHCFKPQDKSLLRPLPIRAPEDGLIQWAQPAMGLYNFIRAQTKPYPCAFSFLGGRKIKIVSMALPDRETLPATGLLGLTVEINGAVWVTCRDGAVRPKLIEVDGSEIDFSMYCRNRGLIGRVFQDQ